MQVCVCARPHRMSFISHQHHKKKSTSHVRKTYQNAKHCNPHCGIQDNARLIILDVRGLQVLLNRSTCLTAFHLHDLIAIRRCPCGASKMGGTMWIHVEPEVLQSYVQHCIAHAHTHMRVLVINLDCDDRQTHVSTPLRKFSCRFLTSRMIKYSRKMCASSSLVVHRYIQLLWSFSGKFHGSSAKDAANQNAHFLRILEGMAQRHKYIQV